MSWCAKSLARKNRLNVSEVWRDPYLDIKRQ